MKRQQAIFNNVALLEGPLYSLKSAVRIVGGAIVTKKKKINIALRISETLLKRHLTIRIITAEKQATFSIPRRNHRTR